MSGLYYASRIRIQTGSLEIVNVWNILNDSKSNVEKARMSNIRISTNHRDSHYIIMDCCFARIWSGFFSGRLTYVSFAGERL